MPAMTLARMRWRWLGEKAGSAARRRMMRTVLLNLTRSGSMPAAVAVAQIRALIA